MRELHGVRRPRRANQSAGATLKSEIARAQPSSSKSCERIPGEVPAAVTRNLRLPLSRGAPGRRVVTLSDTAHHKRAGRHRTGDDGDLDLAVGFLLTGRRGQSAPKAQRKVTSPRVSRYADEERGRTVQPDARREHAEPAKLSLKWIQVTHSARLHRTPAVSSFDPISQVQERRLWRSPAIGEILLRRSDVTLVVSSSGGAKPRSFPGSQKRRAPVLFSLFIACYLTLCTISVK
ncbi:hypothetical protein HPB51_017907 [Rhipicephalus microplus]|uniref:Uncharacterized protein n=1 Tax=Rhipicephalus microplus TaxID=6941 RepID=A0A9J6F5B8_RHIMP|nr:hypothetical protein HPB51_017907 [Rhipicephalus microplus]